MSTWLFQLSPKVWSPEEYRQEVWQGQTCNWPLRRRPSAANSPALGDTLLLFYSATGGKDPGFYGWAVVLQWVPQSPTPLCFRPAPPSDYMKMHPWWDEEAAELANAIRQPVKVGTLWRVPDALVARIREGVRRWVGAAD